ncbi:MAG: enoyl-CoA hydratase-related protein [Candidatus Melainabacteria bacterium]
MAKSSQPASNPAENPSARLILVSQEGRVGLIRFNRPDALNALSPALVRELVTTLETFDADDRIGAVILTGGEKVFAAGADIKAMADQSAIDMLVIDQLALWDRIRAFKKPLIAAINGFALGGGCEVAMMCDILVAGESAQFGQPEISIGVMPGAGGTQRLTRAIGKAQAMKYILTGRRFGAQEALAMGLVSEVTPDELTLDTAMTLAAEIAGKPAMAVRLAKEAVLKAFDGSLSEGLNYERKLFYLLFASADQKEGMAAFAEKRPPVWSHH